MNKNQALFSSIGIFIATVIFTAFGASSSGEPAIDPARALVYFSIKSVEEKSKECLQTQNIKSWTSEIPQIMSEVDKMRILIVEQLASDTWKNAYSTIPTSPMKSNQFMEFVISETVRQGLPITSEMTGVGTESILEDDAYFDPLKQLLPSLVNEIRASCIIRNLQWENNALIDPKKISFYCDHIQWTDYSNFMKRSLMGLPEGDQEFTLQQPDEELDKLWSQTPAPTVEDMHDYVDRARQELLMELRTKNCGI